MRFRLVPTDDKFFALFSQSASSVARCVRALQALLAVLVQLADATVSLMGKLARMNGVRADLDTIDRLESDGDAIYRRALAHLFSGEFRALDVLKWKDTIEAMEAALNIVEDISDVVESIVLKHA